MGIKPGDGSVLTPVRGWQALWRGQFVTELDGHEYAIDVDYLDWAEKSRLYRDGQQVAVGGNPARFPITAATRIETRMSTFGMSRVHLVGPTGAQQLQPAAGTSEAWRLQLDRKAPRLSLALAIGSLTVLLVAALLELPQLLQWWSHSGWWAALTDWRFVSPVTLPAWANAALTVAGVVAGLERALRVRHHWLLDD